MSNIKTVLIDGDILVYRCGFACKDDEPVENALHSVKKALQQILDEFPDMQEYKLFLTADDKSNYRFDVATIKPYKGNRTKPKPKYYHDIRKYMVDYWKAIVISGREADDALGCEQWLHPDRSTVICSIDKDLKQIPGWHFNFVKKELVDVSLDEGNYFFFYQMLVGDTADNIPGIDGVGPKTTEKILGDELGNTAELQRLVEEEYKKQYSTKWREAYNECAILLWMQRKEGEECPYLV